MWWTLLITIGVFAIALLGMAIGVIFGNRRLRGSCGGLAGFRDAQGLTPCDLCTNPSPTCTGKPDEAPSSADEKQSVETS